MLAHGYIWIRITSFLVAALVITSPWIASAQEPTLGKIDFPTSAAPAAQPSFILGVLYLHSFEYAAAAVAFRKAQAIDPDFAMAYWGEAMTHHHSLWAGQDQQAARDVLNRLGKSPGERAAKAPTQREKDYIRAAETLFGMTDDTRALGKLDRDIHYRNAMKQVHAAYPDDLEARALYGLSILGVGSANRDDATYMQAAAILTPVWDANRSHPGAAHYLIHSYDDPVHAILGLPMARAYGKIAVGAAHAQHMTSHIYVALGLWDDMIAANVTALGIESAKTTGEGARSREAWHHTYWLHYGRLQQGRLDDAREILQMALERLSDNPLPREPAYYGAMYARYLIDTERWNEADKWLAPANVHIPSPHYNFARAFAAAKLGQLDKARALMAEIHRGGSTSPEIILSQKEVDILKLQAASVIAISEKQDEQALALARQATQMQASMPFRFGPPRISKPTAELLGDILLALGRDEEASRAYDDQLSRSKLRTNSLLGKARATARSGDTSNSLEAYDALAEIWHRADQTVPALAEVNSRSKEQ